MLVPFFRDLFTISSFLDPAKKYIFIFSVRKKIKTSVLALGNDIFMS